MATGEEERLRSPLVPLVDIMLWFVEGFGSVAFLTFEYLKILTE